MALNVYQALASNRVWRYGRGVPSDSLGSNGECYLDTNSGVAYEKAAGTYTALVVPGSGGVSSVFGRTGAVTAQAGDYTYSQVGAAAASHTHAESDITGLVSDLAGKAAASHTHAAADITSGTLAVARVTAAAAGRALRVNAAGTAIEGYDLNAFTAVPTSPDSWNLEARFMTDPDLANNGWTVKLATTPFTTHTRAGAVDLSTAPASGTYRSSLLYGQLHLQFPTGALVNIYKTTTSGSFTYKSHTLNTRFLANNSNYLWIGDTPQVGAAGENIYFHGVQGTDIVEVKRVNTVATTFTTQANTWPQSDTVKWIHAVTGSAFTRSRLTPPQVAPYWL